MPIKSLLKQTIQNLPENASFNAQSVKPMLLKKGVKPAELEFSGIELPGKGKVTRDQLLNLEKERKDMFYTTDNDNHYKSISLVQGQANPTYREKVLRFEQVDEAGDRYVSDHFPDMPNYLAHTRIYDDSIEGVPTRVLQEIQSDLHQAGRQLGYVDRSVGVITDKTKQEVSALYDDFMAKMNELEYADEITEELEDAEAEALKALEDALTKLDPTWREADIDTEEVAEQVVKGTWDVRDAEGKKLIPKSPYEKDWLSKGIERELSDAIDEGRQQLAIPISGAVENLQRGEGVQKWYETQVTNTAKKIAKKAGMDFEIKMVGSKNFNLDEVTREIEEIQEIAQESGESAALDKYFAFFNKYPVAGQKWGEEGFGYEDPDKIIKAIKGETDSVTYAVIKNTPDSKPDFMLYSTPTAGAFAAYTAYKNGYSEKEVNQYLIGQGYDEEEIADINSKAEKIAQAEAAGYSREEIEQFLQGKEITANVEANEPPPSTLDMQGPGNPTQDVGGLGVPRRLYADVKQEAYDNLSSDDLTASELVRNLQTLQPVLTSDTMTSIPAFFGNKAALQRYDAARRESRGKIIDIAKEEYGIDLVWQEGDVGQEGWYVNTEQGTIEVTPSFWQELKAMKGETIGGIAGGIAGFKYAPANPYAKAAGALIGGISGAVAGGQFDYLETAMEMNMDMEAEVAAHKALNATELAIVGEVISYPVVKSLGAGWRSIVRAKNMIFEGNTQGAYQALKEVTFMSDSEIDEVIMKFEKLAGGMQGNREQKAIQAVALTERGMQDLVRVAGTLDPQASRAVIKAVDDRAADLLKSTADLTDPEIARVYTKDLQNYTQDVKNFYDTVKARATQSPRGLNFDWDYDKLAIEPVLERLATKITDPATSERFLLQAQRIRSFSESRNFGDLIEFRQIVNDFLFNKRIVKADDKKMLRGIIGNIDNAIKDGAPKVVENPEQWLNDWAQARIKYSEMKNVQETAMYKMVFDKKGNMRPVQPETVVKGLTKYMGALDGSFEEVMSKLPKAGRGQYESAVVSHLADKYTAGVKGGMRATHFPMLAEELSRVNFTTPDARAMKKAISEMAETFKNDVHLAQASGKIDIPRFQSYLTTDPVVRAKFEIASGVFNYLKTWTPGKEQRNFALVKNAAKLLEKPLDAKASKDLMQEFSTDVNVTDSIKQLQQEAARAQAKDKDLGGVRVLVDANGKLVKSTSQAARKVPAHRIANEEVIKQVADRESITVDSPMLEKVLKQYGYVAIAQGSDRIRFLGGK